MANQFTQFLNGMNTLTIRQQIARKNGSEPHHVTVEHSGSVITDYDSFPYNRWFRGVARSRVPIVAEREAGWRPRQDACYEPTPVKNYSTVDGLQPRELAIPYAAPDKAFQGSCVLHPQITNNYTTRSCVVNYR